MKTLNIILLTIVAIFYTELSAVDINNTIETNSSDNLNSCLGISKRDLKYCSLIKNRDKKSSCFGIIKRDSGYCTMIKDKDTTNRCLSIALSDISYCDKIKDKDLKESCKLLYIEFESEENKKDCE
jgi:hypothetical protein